MLIRELVTEKLKMTVDEGIPSWAVVVKDIDTSSSQWRKTKQGSIQTKELKAVQQALNHLGYNTGKPDGWFGKKTARGVMKFQEEYDLTVDGDPGKNTIAKINELLLQEYPGLDDSYGMDRDTDTLDKGPSMFDTDVPDREAEGVWRVVPDDKGTFNLVGPDGVVNRSVGMNGRFSQAKVPEMEKYAARLNKEQGLPKTIDTTADPDGDGNADDEAQQDVERKRQKALSQPNVFTEKPPTGSGWYPANFVTSADIKFKIWMSPSEEKLWIHSDQFEWMQNPELYELYTDFKMNEKGLLTFRSTGKNSKLITIDKKKFANIYSAYERAQNRGQDPKDEPDIADRKGPMIKPKFDPAQVVAGKSVKEVTAILEQLIKAKKYKQALAILDHDLRLDVSQAAYDNLARAAANSKESIEEKKRLN